MEKTQLNRHDLVYLTENGKKTAYNSLQPMYSGTELKMLQEVFFGTADVPGIARRDDSGSESVAVGFVHPCRIDGNRLRIGAFTEWDDIVKTATPYEVLRNDFTDRTPCLQAASKVKELAAQYGIEAGILGSAALEIATGLPYTDADSDLDILLKPAAYDALYAFYHQIKSVYGGLNMDFEVDFPNGYGVKLTEIFMNTKTVLGKSIKDISLLSKQEILNYLKQGAKNHGN